MRFTSAILQPNCNLTARDRIRSLEGMLPRGKCSDARGRNTHVQRIKAERGSRKGEERRKEKKTGPEYMHNCRHSPYNETRSRDRPDRPSYITKERGFAKIDSDT